MSMSSGSSLGSLASTGSQGSQGSVTASLSDIYLDPCYHRLTNYPVPEIDREALFERVERVLKCRDDGAPSLPAPSCSYRQFDDVAPRTVVDSLNSSSSDVASSDSGAGCLPTYEQHLELQQKCCGMALPSSVSSLQTSNLSDSLQALGLGPLTSKLIASSTSADCWQHSLSEETTPVATDDTDYHRQPVFSDIPVTTTPTSVRVCTAQFGKK